MRGPRGTEARLAATRGRKWHGRLGEVGWVESVVEAGRLGGIQLVKIFPF
jgi:hypothetical protein